MNLSGRITTTDRTRIFCGDSLVPVGSFLKSAGRSVSRIIVLVDENTGRHCLPVLRQATPLLDSAFVLEVPAGEETKTLHTAMKIWEELLAAGADRKTLLINLGGGMITDLGGFIAAGYKRGISFVNIPTSLIGQVDAAIGGKTGVNFNGIKNQIGFFHVPAAIFIFPPFLETLPEEQLRSGMAEIIKCGLAGDPDLWHKARKIPSAQWLSIHKKKLSDLISGTVAYKNSVVKRDFREEGLRKVLNFGHTIGHALESFSHMQGRRPLLHGEAVAIGMICESYLSNLRHGLDACALEEIRDTLDKLFPSFDFSQNDIPVLISLMEHDKKNRDGKIGFTLLRGIGASRINQSCDQTEIRASLEYYLNDSSS
ncbi:MAG: 3-dehydroquinate synthase [bacterium]